LSIPDRTTFPPTMSLCVCTVVVDWAMGYQASAYREVDTTRPFTRIPRTHCPWNGPDPVQVLKRLHYPPATRHFGCCLTNLQSENNSSLWR
jgi:hypothetical protein